ncbi:MAG TPA: hypothetical protein VGZ47_04935, partial [Gemmataceae bacterium]|nr:hypothetical protein [Gemmataceae bacterium]
MPSIVTCPGCQSQLKIGKPFGGRKCRCPSCNTNFVLGNGPKPGQFLAFELFDENAATSNQSGDAKFQEKERIPVDFNLQLDILPQKENERFLSTDISVFIEPGGASSNSSLPEKPPVTSVEMPFRSIGTPAKPDVKPEAKGQGRESPPVERKPAPKPIAKSGVHKAPPPPVAPSKLPAPASKPPARPAAP